MSTKKSHNVNLSHQEFKLIEALQGDAEMIEELTAATQKLNSEVADGMDAYQAESHIAKTVQEIGRKMIKKWAEKTQEEAVAEATSSSDTLKHGKKNSTGIQPSGE